MGAFTEFVQQRFGELTYGAHTEDGAACALEAVSAFRGLAWSDQPDDVHMPDIRPLNDALWSSDSARTAAMTPLVERYLSWGGWDMNRRSRCVAVIAEQTIRRILPGVLRACGLPDAADRCETEGSAAAARAAYASADAAYAAARAADAADASADAAAAAYAAAYASADAADAAADAAVAADAAADAAVAADAAAYAAAYAAVAADARAAYAVAAAARAARAADAADVLEEACRIWIEAAS